MRVALAVLLLLPLASTLSPAPAVPVLATDFQFIAPVLVVPVGTTVEWTSVVGRHTVTTSRDLAGAFAGEPDDITDSDGDPESFHRELSGSFRHTFRRAGTFAYFCQYHHPFGMVALVQVV